MRAADRVRILHMIDAAESLEQFIAGRERADLAHRRSGSMARVSACARPAATVGGHAGTSIAARLRTGFRSCTGTSSSLMHWCS